METDSEVVIGRAGRLLGCALGTNVGEGEKEAGLTRGRNSNYNAITREASASPTGSSGAGWPFRVVPWMKVAGL